MTDLVERSTTRPSSVIGRDDAMLRLEETLHDRGRPSVCLSGPPGSGKTTLTLRVLDRALDRFADIVFADLHGMSSDEALATVSGRLRSMPARRTRPSETEAAWDPALLVLDHADPLAGSEEEVARRARVEGVSLLLLSVVPMSGPSLRSIHLRPLSATESADLLRQTASLAGVPLGTDATTEALVRRLCEAAGGSPLLIELTASRLASIPLPQLASLLADGEHALDLLSPGGRPRGGARHTVAASREHSSAPARQMLDSLGVFRTSFTHEAMEAVSGLDTVTGYDALRDLVDLHLVRIEKPQDADGRPARYRLPRLVREFVLERQTDSGSLVDVHRRHADHFAAVAAAAAERTRDADDEGAALVLAEDYPEALSAMAWLEHHDPPQALRLATDLCHEALRRGDEATVLPTLQRLLDADHADPELRGDALVGLARGVLEAIDGEGRSNLARGWLDEGMALARATADPAHLLPALMVEALSLPLLRDPDRSMRAVMDGVALASEQGHQRWLARFEVWTGMVHHAHAQLDVAADWGQRGLRRARDCGDPMAVCIAALLLHPLPTEAGVDRRLLPTLETALALTRDLRERRLESAVMLMLASQALARDDPGAAARWLRERYAIAARWRHWHALATQVMVTASLAARLANHAVAARFAGAVHDCAPSVLAGLPDTLGRRYPAAIERARTALGPEAFDAACAEGSLLDLGTAGVESMDYLRRCAVPEAPEVAPADDPQPVPPVPALTTREREVLELLVAGRRNKEIATALFVTPKTVMHHTGSIYRKLGVRGRSEAVVAAMRLGVVAGT